MSTASHSAILVAVMSLVTILLRFLPFLVFRKKVPPCITYLGRVLPPAIIGMLVIYCLKDTVITSAPFGLPELIAGVMVVPQYPVRNHRLYAADPVGLCLTKDPYAGQKPAGGITGQAE